MSNFTLDSIATKVHHLAHLAVALTEFEDREPASFHEIDGFSMVRSLAVILSDELNGLDEDALSLDEDRHFPHHHLAAARGAAAMMVAATEKVEDGFMTEDDFYSFAYIVVQAVTDFASALEAVAYK